MSLLSLRPHYRIIFPPNLKYLEFYGLSLDGASIPLSVTHLKFNFFDEPVCFPPRLVVLDVGGNFSQNLNILPSSLRELTISSYYSGPITSLPPNLTHFSFGDSIFTPISCFPLSLAHLTVGNSYNFPLPSFPLLVYLEVGNNFNQELPVLPKLETLSCGRLFDKSISSFASSLKFLTLGECYDRIIPHLPHLVSLYFAGDHLQFEEPNLCKINNLTISLPSAHITALPLSLVRLTINSVMTKDIIDNIPQSVERIDFLGNFNHTVDHLPHSLTHLYFGKHFNQIVDHLPSSIIDLTFGENFNQPVDHLPSSLLSLEFGQNFNQKVDHLPSSLTYLTFGDEFNQSISNLPHSLTHLVLGRNFRKKSIAQALFSWYPNFAFYCFYLFIFLCSCVLFLQGDINISPSST